MKKTPLYDWHVKHDAKMVEFGGYLMPVSYEGVLAEHQAVREHCGLFDISHMGEIYLEGAEAGPFLQYLTSNDISRLENGKAQYSLLLNPKAGVIDDIIVYRINPQHYMLCVNAANTDKDFRWIQSHLPSGLQAQNQSEAMGLIALQGPQSPEILSRLNFELLKLAKFQFAFGMLAGIPVMVSRTGYTGEEGCEIFLENAGLLKVWEALFQEGGESQIRPIGLGARDTLRLEKGYSLYGHEITEEVNPLEAGLAWVVKMDKGDFVGRPALFEIQKRGVARNLVGLRMEEPGIPREGLSVTDGNQVIGRVCSGTYSPTLKVGIATALLKANGAVLQREIFIDIRGKLKKAKIVKLPFVR